MGINYLHIINNYKYRNKKIRKHNNVDVSLKNKKSAFNTNYFSASVNGFNLVLNKSENILNKKFNGEREKRLFIRSKNIYFGTNSAFLFLVNYFNYFFSKSNLGFKIPDSAVEKLEKNSIKCLQNKVYKYEASLNVNKLLVSIVPGTAGILRYLARKLNASFSSVFVPDIFTNLNVYKLTEFYENGVDFQFLLNNEEIDICLFFSSENSKDYLIFKHLLKSVGFFVTFTRNEDIMCGSDIYFPFEVSDASGLFGASLFLNSLFYK